MSDQDGQPGAGPQKGDEIASSRMVTQFVIFPLAIVAVGVCLYLFLGILTSEDRTARDYLNTIKTGGLNSRWQAAYELVKVLSAERREGRVDPAFADDMVRVFESSRQDDPRIRRYLARAMEMVPDSSVEASLVAALDDPDEETRLYAIASLGGLRARSATPRLVALSESGDPGFRKAVVFALGQIGGDEATAVLRRALRDNTDDVRWNAALQLASHDDDAGVSVLAEMINRDYLERVEEMTEEQRALVMVYAVHALGRLDVRRFLPELQALREGDPNLKVRQAAIEVLDSWK